MSILNKIKAIFSFGGKKEEMEVTAAEVNQEGVILHPVEDPEHVFFVKSQSVNIVINPEGELTEDDIEIHDKETLKKQFQEHLGITDEMLDSEEKELPIIRPIPLSRFMPSKKRFVVTLYQDEYDNLMKTITENGYKKTEYFLACMTSAKKTSMSAEYKRYADEHKIRRKTDIQVAKQAQAEDLVVRQQGKTTANKEITEA